MTDQQRQEFEAVTRPVIEWLNANCHPHVTVVIEPTGAMLSEESLPTQPTITCATDRSAGQRRPRGENGIEMIDINELRRKLGSDDLMDRVDIHANVKSTLTELLDRLEAAEKDIALKERIIDSLGSELNAVSNERDELTQTAFRIADEASVSLVQCNAQSIDAWMYALTGEEMADKAMDEAVTYLVRRGLAYLHEAGYGWLVILETEGAME